MKVWLVVSVLPARMAGSLTSVIAGGLLSLPKIMPSHPFIIAVDILIIWALSSPKSCSLSTPVSHPWMGTLPRLENAWPGPAASGVPGRLPLPSLTISVGWHWILALRWPSDFSLSQAQRCVSFLLPHPQGHPSVCPPSSFLRVPTSYSQRVSIFIRQEECLSSKAFCFVSFSCPLSQGHTKDPSTGWG